MAKGADVIVFLTDSNDENWREVQKRERSRCPACFAHLTVFGVAKRNVECWRVADPAHVAAHTDREEKEFRVADPKGVVESAFRITRLEKQEARIAEYVRRAPLRQWLSSNESFEDFFDQLWQMTKALGCKIENLHERRV